MTAPAPARTVLTPALEDFLLGELSNERHGGVAPATLSSAVDSLHQGGADTFGLAADDVVALLALRDARPGGTEVRDLL